MFGFCYILLCFHCVWTSVLLTFCSLEIIIVEKLDYENSSNRGITSYYYIGHSRDVMPVQYSRDQLYAIRRANTCAQVPLYELKSLGLLRYQGRRGGRYARVSRSKFIFNENKSSYWWGTWNTHYTRSWSPTSANQASESCFAECEKGCLPLI